MEDRTGSRASAWWRSGRAVGALTVLSALLVVAVVAVPFRLSTSALQHAAHNHLSSTTSVAGFAVERRMETLGRLVGAYAADPQLVAAARAARDAPPSARAGRRPVPPDVRRLLARLQASGPHLLTAALVDTSGQTVAISPHLERVFGPDLRVRDWYRGAVASPEPYVSQMYVTPLLPGEPLLAAAAVAVRAPGAPADAEPLGVLVVTYDVVQDLQPYVDALADREQVALTITDQAGHVVAAPGRSAGLRRLDEPGVTAALFGTASSREVVRHGQVQLAAYAPVHQTGWTVTAAAPKARAFADAGRLRSAVLAVAAVLGAVLLLCLVGLARAARAQARVRADLARAAAESAAALEREQHAMDELRQVDQAKDRFLSSVSHELRTPLTSMIGYAELLRDGELEPLNGPQQTAVSGIERNGHRLLGLVEDLMSYTQLSSGRVELALEPVDVAALLDGVASAVAAQVAVKQHDLTVRVSPGTQPVHGDVVQLDRMLLNLATNAVKFTPPGGRITLTAGPGGPGQVRLQVSDTGTGISEREQTQLFSRFFRSAQTMRDALPGTGLGLVMVSTIVEAHRGTVDLLSVVDEGTTVTVDLPVAPGPAAPAAGAAAAAGPQDVRTTATSPAAGSGGGAA